MDHFESAINSRAAVSDELIQRLLRQLDEALAPIANGEFLDLYHLGRSALVWRYQAKFSTKDIDFVAMRTPLEQKAIQLFGKDSTASAQLGVYLDFVPEGLPPLPQGFKARSVRVQGDWNVIRLWELEEHDLASTKMKTFRPQDRQDLRFMCDRGLLDPTKLRASRSKMPGFGPRRKMATTTGIEPLRICKSS